MVRPSSAEPRVNLLPEITAPALRWMGAGGGRAEEDEGEEGDEEDEDEEYETGRRARALERARIDVGMRKHVSVGGCGHSGVCVAPAKAVNRADKRVGPCIQPKRDGQPLQRDGQPLHDATVMSSLWSRWRWSTVA